MPSVTVPLQKGLTALHIAVSGYNETAVSLLLADPRVDVNARDRVSSSLWDCLRGLPRWLPDCHCAPSKFTSPLKVGLTPLHVAAQVGRAASVRLLLADARVDVAATSRVSGGRELRGALVSLL